jgi:hypothetical protein
MSTLAQITANRANAQLSTGPKTPAGRLKVGRNRITHGLTGRAVLIPGEDPAEFDALALRMAVEMCPGTSVEESLVRNLTNIQWRLDRIAGWIGELTTEALTGEESKPSRLMKMFSKTGDPCEALERLHRHEASLNRQYQRVHAEFHRSRKERSKLLLGQNPAAYNDLVDLVEAAREVLASQGISLRETPNSKPISGSSTPNSDPTPAEKPASLVETPAPEEAA